MPDDAILHTEMTSGTQGQLVADNTSFGWTLIGAVIGSVQPEQPHVKLIQCVPMTDDLLKKPNTNINPLELVRTKER